MSAGDAAGEEANEKPSPGRRFELGSVAQASVPGMYAWFVTVAPAAWSRGAPLAVKLIALAGVAVLVASASSSAAPRWSRLASVASPARASSYGRSRRARSPEPARRTRGMTGMIAWALFAYASAAPTVPRLAPPSADELPRAIASAGDALFVAAGVVLAVHSGAQLADPVARAAVLVRIVCIGLGMPSSARRRRSR